MDRVETSKKFYVLINDKKSISMNGVSNVRAFDESYVTLETEQGTVNVEGASLKIESLTKESGEIFISGEIYGVFFAEERGTQSVFKRLFK